MSNSIGSWNGSVFKVSSEKIFSLSDISVKRSSRWATHYIIGKVPKMEFQGMDQIAVECKIILDATFGVKPIEQAEKFHKALNNGTAAKLVIAGKAISNNKFVLTDISEEYDIITNAGKVQRLTLSLSFKEYR